MQDMYVCMYVYWGTWRPVQLEVRDHILDCICMIMSHLQMAKWSSGCYKYARALLHSTDGARSCRARSNLRGPRSQELPWPRHPKKSGLRSSAILFWRKDWTRYAFVLVCGYASVAGGSYLCPGVRNNAMDLSHAQAQALLFILAAHLPLTRGLQVEGLLRQLLGQTGGGATPRGTLSSADGRPSSGTKDSKWAVSSVFCLCLHLL